MSDISNATKGYPQSVKGGAWYSLFFVEAGQKFTRFKPATGRCEITAQLYATLPASGRPTYIKVRLVRVATPLDPTAYDTIALPPKLREWSTVYTTFMQTNVNIPLAVQVYHDGTSPVVFGNRIVKMDVN